MQNDGIEIELIIEWWDNIPYELKIQKETESYDKITRRLSPKYPYIWYKLGLAYDSIGYKQKAKEYFHRMESTKE